jgi:hypothetical protein
MSNNCYIFHVVCSLVLIFNEQYCDTFCRRRIYTDLNDKNPVQGFNSAVLPALHVTHTPCFCSEFKYLRQHSIDYIEYYFLFP